MRCIQLAAAVVLLAGCATINELAEGNPTPALSMYFAQAEAAAHHCGVAEATMASRQPRKSSSYYRKKYPVVANHFPVYRGRYDDAWEAADADSRRAFCEGYAREMNELGPLSSVNFVTEAIRVFSPPSAEAVKRGQRIAGVLSLGAVAATATASIQSSHAGVQAAKAGDFGASRVHMSESSAFNRVGLAFINPTDAGVAPIGPYGCPAQDHFARYDDPVDSPVWMTFRTSQDVARCTP